MSESLQEEARRAALTNLRRAIDGRIRLPRNVFTGEWCTYRFFESDNMFSDRFAEAVQLLLPIEGSTTVYVVNLDTPNANQQGGAAYVLNEVSDPVTYRKAMQNLAIGYISRARFASMSDVGAWCAYCENVNDVGVMAIRDELLAARLEPALRSLWAKRLYPLTVKGGPDAAFPFTDLTREWYEGLSRNFA